MGCKAGLEMIAGIKEGKKNDLNIALIDRDI